MDKLQTEWYLDSIKHELLKLDDKGFIGNIDFKVNVCKGGISNMTITLIKSVKMPDSIR